MKKYLFFIFMIALSGCSIKSLPPTKSYTINTQIHIKSIAINHQKCKSIKINFPDSSNFIMSTNMIYVKGLQKNSYYFSKWYETPNQMLNDLFYTGLSQSKICKNIYSFGLMIPSDLVLKSQILDFSQKFIGNHSFSEVKIIFFLVNKDNLLIAQKEFDTKVICDTNNAQGGVKALSKASKQITSKMINWLYKILDK